MISVGVIDSYFPDAHFFTEFERFDRHIDKMNCRGQKIDSRLDLLTKLPPRCPLPVCHAVEFGRNLREAARPQSVEP